MACLLLMKVAVLLEPREGELGFFSLPPDVLGVGSVYSDLLLSGGGVVELKVGNNKRLVIHIKSIKGITPHKKKAFRLSPLARLSEKLSERRDLPIFRLVIISMNCHTNKLVYKITHLMLV